MRVEVEHLPESQVQLQIEVDPDMLGQAVGKAYQRLAGRYRVPGFRPGKAPRAVLERAIGPEVLLSEAADIAMNDAYAQAIKEQHLHPLGYPDVQSPKSDEIAADKPLSFTATVYVRPHVKAGDYRSLRVAPEIPDVTTEDVDRVLQNVQEEQAPWEPVEDRPAENDDLVTLRLLATVGDETLVDQDSWEYRLREDESPTVPIPGLSQRLAGMRTGESKDETIDLPEDYNPTEYAGKQMALHIEVLRIDRKLRPELDDSFARTLGNFETVDELRAALTQNMQAQARRQAMDAYVENVIQQVVAQADVTAPPPLIDQEVDEMMRQLQENVERERKISMDTYTRVIGKTVEQLREEARPTAEQRVRSDLVLDAVAEEEGVEVPTDEIDAQVRLVAGSPTLSNKERRRLLASDDLRERVARRLRRRYTINRLLEVTNPPETTTVSDDSGEPAAAPATEEPVAGETSPVLVSSETGTVAGAQETTSDQQSE
ncbi:MAG: trigger factor [Chloroflexi bacterium]|nr:trigger factor [Chloroflexota bacterium]